jgi:hypothetical protein
VVVAMPCGTAVLRRRRCERASVHFWPETRSVKRGGGGSKRTSATAALSLKGGQADPRQIHRWVAGQALGGWIHRAQPQFTRLERGKWLCRPVAPLVDNHVLLLVAAIYPPVCSMPTERSAQWEIGQR